MRDDATPHPPATPEFGAVSPGGPTHTYSDEVSGVHVKKFAVGPYDNNVYVIASDGEAILVDGAAEPERILAELKGLEVVSIVETHGHPDHVQALPELVDALGVTVFAHPGDRWPVPIQPLAGGEVLVAGRARVRAIHTPGHTPGSTTYALLANDEGPDPIGTVAEGDPGGEPVQLFTGDTLFPGGPGNTGNGTAAFERIMRSLDELFGFADDVRVSPGHGLDTTLGRERPYLEVWRRRGW
jgi:glyoxylase-like metal-dependent hydrolase (beta-lactamase superfamily II)